MLVCAHGDVAAFCKDRGMEVRAVWKGRLEEYAGILRVIVTDSIEDPAEYYYLKVVMLGKGYELISTRHSDSLLYRSRLDIGCKKQRQSFADEAVMQRIRELNTAGLSLRRIRDTDGVSHPDGRKLSISTISKIIKNEKET